MRSAWKSYKHRFIPWLAINWSSRQVKKVRAEPGAREAEALLQLSDICRTLNLHFPSPLTVKGLKKMGERGTLSDSAIATETREVLKKEHGVSLSVGQSEMGGGAGVGVFTRTAVARGKIVGLYPGTVYLPFEPLFFQSLRNQYLLRCADGRIIDGKSNGLSRRIFMSCAYRDAIGPVLSCDPTWLLKMNATNPLSIGQLVNNHSRTADSNVDYVEVDIPENFPSTWRQFLPNVFYSPQDEYCNRLMKCVVLLTTRPVQAREELLSSYLTVITD